MKDSEPYERKTDYFGTFLDVLSRGVTHATSALGSALATSGDPRDAAIRMLANHGGSLSIGELLVPPFASVGPLMAVIQDLQGFGLAEREGGVVRLTAEGVAVARKLGVDVPGLPTPSVT